MAGKASRLRATAAHVKRGAVERAAERFHETGAAGILLDVQGTTEAGVSPARSRASELTDLNVEPRQGVAKRPVRISRATFPSGAWPEGRAADF